MEHRVAERLPRKQEGAGSSPAVRARLIELAAKAAQIRGSVGQVVDRRLGKAEVAVSSTARSSASGSESAPPL
jgi:hypothetical protein